MARMNTATGIEIAQIYLYPHLIITACMQTWICLVEGIPSAPSHQV
jgi:hypothetical protein